MNDIRSLCCWGRAPGTDCPLQDHSAAGIYGSTGLHMPSLRIWPQSKGPRGPQPKRRSPCWLAHTSRPRLHAFPVAASLPAISTRIVRLMTTLHAGSYSQHSMLPDAVPLQVARVHRKPSFGWLNRMILAWMNPVHRRYGRRNGWMYAVPWHPSLA